MGLLKNELPEKWIEIDTADARPVDVAILSLQNRLGAVLRLLPGATARSTESADDVHELRIWTRRAMAALDLYEEFLPRRRLAWIKKKLKRIRRAANDARDGDVLIGRLKSRRASRGVKRWLELACDERHESQLAMLGVHKRLARGDRFERRIEKLLKKARSKSKKNAKQSAGCFSDWAATHFPPLVERFFEVVPTDKMDTIALHQFRMQAKELRYDIELVAAVFPTGLRTVVYPVIEAIQDRLGAVNDLASAQARLEKHLAASDDATEKAAWRRLLAKEQALLQQACRAFWDWCTPKRLQELRRSFEHVIPSTP